VVEFADGVTVLAAWHAAGEDIVLDIPSYRTAKGTQVKGRTWRLVRGKEGVWRAERAG
jgi:hypothetical protein